VALDAQIHELHHYRGGLPPVDDGLAPAGAPGPRVGVRANGQSCATTRRAMTRDHDSFGSGPVGSPVCVAVPVVC